jgi:hypothetical protein
MYGRKIYADHNLIINQLSISGVTSFTSDFDVPYENIDVLGNSFLVQVNREITKTMSFSRFLNQSDNLKYLTGSNPCRGFVSYGNKSYGFEEAYLTSYNVSCEVGGLAEVTTDFVIYGNVGSGITQTVLPSLPVDPSNTYVANSNSIILNASEGLTNRIVSFDYNITCNREPLFLLGSTLPKFRETFLKKPLIIDLSINIDIDDYASPTAQSLICNPNIQNLEINLYNCNKTQILETFYAPNARLVSNSYNISIENQSNVELTFRSILM